MFMRLMRSLFHVFENEEVPVVNIFFSGLFAILIRCFFESFSQQSTNYFNLNSGAFAGGVVHWALFYVVTAIGLVIIIHYATREKIKPIFKVIFSGMIFLILSPIIDLLVSAGLGYNMYYLPPDSTDLFKNFFTYMSAHPGSTPGIKIEFFIMCSMCFLYLYTKGKGVALSLAYVIIFYSFVFFLSVTPSVLKTMMTFLGFRFKFTNLIAINYFSILLLITSLWMLWLANNKLAKILLADCRLSRMLYFMLMLLLGVTLGFVTARQPVLMLLHANPVIISDTIFLLISLVFASFFTIVCNNIADVEIDRISNPTRPLIQNQIDQKTYQSFAWYALIASIYFASLTGVKGLLLILFVVGIYYLYSVPPFRFKRVFLLSKFTVSLSSLAMVILGYLTVHNNIAGLPSCVYPIFLIGITLCANVIDIKDIEGDRMAGIKTLPVISGLNLAKRIVGTSIIFTYTAFYFLVQSAMLGGVFFVLGGVQYYLVNHRQYAEWKVMLLNQVAFLILLGYFAEQITHY